MGVLTFENFGAGSRLVQCAHVVDGETEAQSKERTSPGTHGPGGNAGTGSVVCSPALFLLHLALRMQILISTEFNLDVLILS